MAEQWYSIVEYAREFAVSDMTVRRRIKTGRLNAVLRDGKYYIPVSATQAAKLRSSAGNDGHDDGDYPQHAPAAVPRYETTPYNQPTAPRYIEQAARARESAHHRPVRREVGPRQMPETRSQLIPAHILAKLETYDKSLVDTKALLDFCEHTVSLVNKVEVKLQEQFESKIHSLHSEIRGKNIELNQLQQQVEDLQCLVKILERKSIA